MKVQIRRQPDGWQVERPRFGFGPPERRTFATWPEALAWTQRTIAAGRHHGTSQIWLELAYQQREPMDQGAEPTQQR